NSGPRFQAAAEAPAGPILARAPKIRRGRPEVVIQGRPGSHTLEVLPINFLSIGAGASPGRCCVWNETIYAEGPSKRVARTRPRTAEQSAGVAPAADGAWLLNRGLPLARFCLIDHENKTKTASCPLNYLYLCTSPNPSFGRNTSNRRASKLSTRRLSPRRSGT